MDYDDTGFCRDVDVFLNLGRTTCVLGPDGEPLRYVERYKAGFDLRPKADQAKSPQLER